MAGVIERLAIGAAIKHMSGPFSWGPNDCSSSVFNAFNDLWGIDILEGLPEYNGLRQTAEFMRDHGGRNDCHEWLFERSGLIECDPDAGVICASWPTGRRWSLGFCLNGKETAFKTETGFCILPNFENSKFWGPSCLF